MEEKETKQALFDVCKDVTPITPANTMVHVESELPMYGKGRKRGEWMDLEAFLKLVKENKSKAIRFVWNRCRELERDHSIEEDDLEQLADEILIRKHKNGQINFNYEDLQIKTWAYLTVWGHLTNIVFDPNYREVHINEEQRNQEEEAEAEEETSIIILIKKDLLKDLGDLPNLEEVIETLSPEQIEKTKPEFTSAINSLTEEEHFVIISYYVCNISETEIGKQLATDEEKRMLRKLEGKERKRLINTLRMRANRIRCSGIKKMKAFLDASDSDWTIIDVDELFKSPEDIRIYQPRDLMSFSKIKRRIKDDFEEGNITSLITLITDQMNHFSGTPLYDFVRIKGFSNEHESVAICIENFIQEETNRVAIGAILIELDDLNSTPDEWSFRVYSCEEYSGFCEDEEDELDRLSGIQPQSYKRINLTGLENIQEKFKSYDNGFYKQLEKDYGRMCDYRYEPKDLFCLLIVLHFYKLICESVSLIKNLDCPIIVMSHGYDFIYEYKNDNACLIFKEYPKIMCRIRHDFERGNIASLKTFITDQFNRYSRTPFYDFVRFNGFKNEPKSVALCIADFIQKETIDTGTILIKIDDFSSRSDKWSFRVFSREEYGDLDENELDQLSRLRSQPYQRIMLTGLEKIQESVGNSDNGIYREFEKEIKNKFGNASNENYTLEVLFCLIILLHFFKIIRESVPLIKNFMANLDRPIIAKSPRNDFIYEYEDNAARFIFK